MKEWLKVFGYMITGAWLCLLFVIAWPEILKYLDEHLSHPWLFIPMVVFIFGMAVGLYYITWVGILAYRILRESPSPDSTLNDTDNDGVHPP